MDKSYWLSRTRASAVNAARAKSAEARLVHLDLAGRYSVKAAQAAAEAGRVTARLQVADGSYYEKLEIGARWLASRAPCEEERSEHLGVANRYARMRLEAATRR